MFNNTRNNAENDVGTRLIGIPNGPTPTPTSVRVHHLHPDNVAVGSPLSRVSTPFSNGFGFSPYSASSAPSRNDHCPTQLWLEKDSSSRSDNWVDDLVLSNDFSRMNISVIDGTRTRTRGYDMNSYAFSLDGNVPFFNETGTQYQHVSNEGVSQSLPFCDEGYTFGTPTESSFSHDHTNQVYHHMRQMQGTGSGECDGQVQLQNPSFINPYLCDRFVGSQPLGMNCEAGCGLRNPFKFSQMMHPRIALNPNVNGSSHHCPVTSANNELPHCLSPRRAGGDPAPFRCDNSIIIQGKDMKNCIENGYNSLRGYKKNSRDEVAIHIVGDDVSRHISRTPANQICKNNSTLASHLPLPPLLNFYSLAEVRAYIHNMAKDQNGCRFLQRMVDEGTCEDMCMVFEGIIHNVVELMLDPFGNYLVQKLLDVCNEDQRLQIVLMLTKEPGQLVRISLNTHGTRVVQKLIETLNSGKQISLVKSAIQPGFLELIKDLNGNHVIQRCLQCLSCQDNQFIFDAAEKFCLDIATHRHGCCVLQRCIDHSMGKHRDKLVTEICKHGLLLAQDPYGNYVVQYIIEMETQTASTKLIGQFKGNYVNLSKQKCSSHVVEKCLRHVGDSRSRIVRELLSAPHFEQLLQDPFANYVIQCALAVTKGSLHASLVEAVRPYKILRTSPYCKKIFSGSVFKK
ncbi:putative pumilio homolog 7, chloroplastic [Gastrolobium bilobum]|uniref:putative pumilio homolog 7, chloroplastic n=1 Tax=Gastrolobium bilobum TaxID=150636 RepID=UPI002AB0E806|nr:putative pumilio homolog 7, chloroplastic [Gastrolobium bilobum]